MIADRYTFRIEWSNAQREHIATVQEFPSLSWNDDSPALALQGLIRLIGEVLLDMRENGEMPPTFGAVPS